MQQPDAAHADVPHVLYELRGAPGLFGQGDFLVGGGGGGSSSSDDDTGEVINNCQMLILNTTKYNMCIDTGVVYTYTIIYSC